MDAPSHHQSSFFAALNEREDIDLQVRYFHNVSERRQLEGWPEKYEYKPYELCVAGIASPEKLISTVENTPNHIHIISISFNRQLVDFFCTNNVRWCHWSEKPGIGLAKRLGYRMSLFHALHPLLLLKKSKQGKQIAQYAKIAFCQSSPAVSYYRALGVPKNKLELLHYALPQLDSLPANEQIISFAEGRKAFLCVASLYRGKGIDLLLKAFKKLRTNDWILVLCGVDKSKGLYQKQAKKLEIESQILFTGAIPHAEISSVYGASDVLVLPSRWDGWGAVLNEAASLGLPLIGSDMCGASWHLIKDKKNGFIVKADSVSALHQAMQRYVDSPKLCNQHGQESKKLFFEEFTPEKNADRLLNALQQVSL